jgi:hypothetical protein
MGAPPGTDPVVVVEGRGGLPDAVVGLLPASGVVVRRAAASGGAGRVGWEDGGGPPVELDDRPAAAAWAASGAMAITGRPDGPPALAGAGLIDGLRAAAALLALVTGRRGRPVVVDPLVLLGERAAIAGFRRRGADSVGGNAHLLRAADGWLCLNLGRPDDLDLLPAWLEADVAASDWSGVAAAVASRPRAELAERAGLLGLPVGAAPSPGVEDEQLRARGQGCRPRPALVSWGGPRRGRGDGHRPLVVDLSSLWAGPLCSRLLAAAGARVVKVEGARRPDGARRGPAAFFDLLHAGAEAVTVDFEDPADMAFLRALLGAADVVVEGSRPRVLDGLGIDPAAHAAMGAVWVSITGYGRAGPWANRVAFGDDAAVAGGLVVPGEPPCFVADAVADPSSGLLAALYASRALLAGRGAVLDVALREVAAHLAGDGRPPEGRVVETAEGRWAVVGDGWSQPVERPWAPTAASAAPTVGQHDAALRAAYPS